MKLPNLGLDKIASGGRAVWNMTAKAGGLMKSKRAMVAAATLGAGTLASSAGYFIWQGRSGQGTDEVAATHVEGHEGKQETAAASTELTPIQDDGGAGAPTLDPAAADHQGSFGQTESSPLRPPPASAFRNGFQASNEQVGNESDPGLGQPAAEEAGAPVAEGTDLAAQGVSEGVPQVGMEEPAPEEAPATANLGGRPRVLAVGDSPIRPAAGDAATEENPAAMAQEAAPAAEPGSEPAVAVPTDPPPPTEGGAPNETEAPPETAPLRNVPNVNPGAGAAAVRPQEPVEPPPPPDRIEIPAEPATPPPAAGGFSNGGSSRFGAAPTLPPSQPSTRFGGAPSLAPVPGASLGAADAASGFAGGAAAGAAGGAASGMATGAAAGALAGGAAVGLGASLADAGPTIARPTPGPKELEGAQTPSLTLEKSAPAEIQVGKPAIFQLKVRNVGRTAAHGVVITDHIPAGTKLLDADPEYVSGADGAIRWQLGTIPPNQEAVIAIKLLPEQEGEIGSVAQVSFQSQASVRTVCTRPRITLQHQTQPKALVGDDVVLAITIANNGTGAATGLVIEEAVPAGLSHPVDKELEYQIGTLKPGESRRLELTLKAAQAGIVENILVARSDDTVVAEDRLQLEVVAPQLRVGLTGPKVRYLDRQATYSVAVSNPGTAPGKNIELAAYLPRGLKFVSAENQGQYDAKLHAVFWGLADLPVAATGAAQLTVLPIEPGQQAIRVAAQGDLGIKDELQQAVVVETQSELQFSVADVADPIEVGSETTYDIRVSNRGTRAATNVQVAIEFPAELQPVGGDGPSRVSVRGQQLIVEPLGRLAPDTEARYKIQVRGLRAGDPRIRVQLSSAESPSPVSKEESTRVYADE